MPSVPLAGLAIVLLIPPLLTGLLGGADLDIGASLRVSWFAPLGVGIALGVAFADWIAEPRGGVVWRGAALLASLSVWVAVWVAWTGGTHGSWLSLRSTPSPAGLGAALLTVAWLRGTRLRGSRLLYRRILRGAAPGMAGLALFGAVQLADQVELRGRIPVDGRTGEGRPDVIFLLADTLRADALGCYGAKPSRTPFLDDLAAESIRFEFAFSQAPWTLASMWSLMTALHPSTLFPEERGEPSPRVLSYLPPADLERLVDQLRRGGYHTAGFQKNDLLAPGSGLEVGFDVYERVRGDYADLESGRQLVDAALRWARVFARARRERTTAPFFLYLHFMDPHIDYRPPAGFLADGTRDYEGPVDGDARTIHRLVNSEDGPTPDDVKQMRRLYQGEVAYLDAQLERLQREMKTLGLWSDETVVVFVADHGEQFGEHGDFEHSDIHVENTRVPLLLRAPALDPGAYPEAVRLIDLSPTLLDLLDAPRLGASEGRSLLPLLGSGAGRDERRSQPVITEYGDTVRISLGGFSLLRYPDRVELYELAADPGEQRNLAARQPARVRTLLDALEAHQARDLARLLPASAGERTLDAETREALERLGYIGYVDERP